jgi:integrase
MIMVENAISDFLKYKISKRKDHKTIHDIELALRTLLFVRPDIQYLQQITKATILEFEMLVSQVPAHYRITKKYRSMTFRELQVAAANRPKLSPASIDKYVLTLRAFIGWCQDSDLMPPWKLPRFEGLDKRNSKDKRHPFTSGELKGLLASPQFTGHKPDLPTQTRRYEWGPVIIKDCHYWVPLLGLYTGMRLREIIQLWVTDVRLEDGVVYLDINRDGDKSLKNTASLRRVPIHHELIRLGFLEHVEAARQAGHTKVFHDAPVTAAGAVSDIFSKWFGRYLKAIGVKHAKLSFHSLRHTFIDQAARQARLPDHIIKALVGHADHTMTFGTYGGRLSLAELGEAINRITYLQNAKPI